jgi:hypothetical protein
MPGATWRLAVLSQNTAGLQFARQSMPARQAVKLLGVQERPEPSEQVANAELHAGLVLATIGCQQRARRNAGSGHLELGNQLFRQTGTHRLA